MDLSVPAGSIFGLLGHNGAGKSTALGMLLGQVYPDRGQLRVAGHDVREARAAALQRTGAIFETPAFYEYLTGKRNLKLLAAYSGGVSRQRLEQVIALVGLTQRIKDPVVRYSHGMRQRLALAQALLPQPEVLILDEPSDGLDPEGIREMRELIRYLNQDHGITVLLSSHQLGEVESLCTHIAIMRQGRVLFHGPWHGQGEADTWLRLDVTPREAALTSLQNAGLIAETAGDAVRLSAHVSSHAVARHLVTSGFALGGMTPSGQSLEDFYLQVVREAEQENGHVS
jgi:ABC-2 type transport system ATP-binding protein